MLGIVDDLLSRALFNNDAAVHEHDAVGDIARERHLMRHNDHGHMLSGELLDDLQHLSGKLRVERTGGFVEEHDIGVQAQCASNGNALLLSARKFARNLALVALEAHFRDKFAGLAFNIGLIALLHSNGRIHDVFEHRVVREQVVVLKHKAKARFRCAKHVLFAINRLAILHSRDLKVAIGKLACIERFEQRGATQKRRFAAARRTDNGNNLARVHLERNIFQHLGIAEAFLDVRQAHDRFVFGHSDLRIPPALARWHAPLKTQRSYRSLCLLCVTLRFCGF